MYTYTIYNTYLKLTLTLFEDCHYVHPSKEHEKNQWLPDLSSCRPNGTALRQCCSTCSRTPETPGGFPKPAETKAEVTFQSFRIPPKWICYHCLSQSNFPMFISQLALSKVLKALWDGQSSQPEVRFHHSDVCSHANLSRQTWATMWEQNLTSNFFASLLNGH